MRALGKVMGLGVLLLLLFTSLDNLPAKAGQTDFRAYWSAGHLLTRGENFADEGALLAVQQEVTGFDRDYAMSTWNPPWVLVWLVPYTLVNFATAANLWLLTNVAALFLGVVVAWQRLFPDGDRRNRWLWLPLLAAVVFPSTIVSLLYGQVNLLVLGGLVGFLALYTNRRDAAAGAALALTTFKPHLVYLVVPVILLEMWRRRRRRVLLGFFGLILASTAIVFVLRPTFVSDYVRGATAGNLLAWEAATAVTYLSQKTGWLWLRLVAVGLAPLLALSWFLLDRKWDLMNVAQIGVLASIITMPFGWSYDFVVLLLPLTQVLVWVVASRLFVVERVAVIIALVVTYVIYYYQRIATPSELYFFWVPVVIAAIYGWMARRCAGKEAPGLQREENRVQRADLAPSFSASQVETSSKMVSGREKTKKWSSSG